MGYSNPRPSDQKTYLSLSQHGNYILVIDINLCIICLFLGEKLSLRIMKSVARAILTNYTIEPCGKTASRLPVVDHNFGRVIDRDIWLRFKPRF